MLKGYENGIPDEADPRLEGMGLAPSYRQICRAIIKNDAALTSLGFSRPKCETYSFLKKIEIEAREKK
jgi:predicted phosphoadenosine phosphosulfate sulfurtransferase